MLVALDKSLETSPSKAPATDALKLDALTSLRFFAALMIVLLHFDQMILREHQTFLSLDLALQQGVSFFFVLSGFILYYRYPSLPTMAACKKFFAARFARIYPTHLIATLLFMAAVPAQIWCTAGKRTFWLFAAVAAMIQSAIPKSEYYYAINPPDWSISTEFGFYLLFPLLIYRWRQTRFLKLGISVAILLGFMAFAENFRNQPLPKDAAHFEIWLLYINPLVRLVEFVTGMLTANLFLYLREKWNPSSAKISLLQVSAIAIVGAGIVFMKDHPLVPVTQVLPHAWTYWAEGSGGFLSYAFLIFAMSYSTGFVSKVLSQPLFVFLGEVSFSIYLLHWMVIDILLVNIINHKLVVNPTVVLPLFLGVNLVLATLMHLIVEKPLRKTILNAFSKNAKVRASHDANFSIAEVKTFYQDDVVNETSMPAGKV